MKKQLYDNFNRKVGILYLCGPMYGLKDSNIDSFNKEAARLRALGYSVINPAELAVTSAAKDTSEYWDALRSSVIAMIGASDGLALLPDYIASSNGAMTEIIIAKLLNMPIFHSELITEQNSDEYRDPLPMGISLDDNLIHAS